MKKSSSELKKEARELLKNNYSTCVWITLINFLLPMFLLLPFALNTSENPDISQLLIENLASLIVSLLSVILSCGIFRFYLNLSRGNTHNIADILSGFKTQPQKIVGAYILLSLRILLVMLPGSILLVLAADVLTFSLPLTGIALIIFMIGLIWTIRISLEYNLIYYLYLDAPEEKLGNIFKKSKELMKGNKLRCLYLMFSFLGWYLLGILSFGIGLLWIIPYASETLTLFYLDVLKENEPVQPEPAPAEFDFYA